MSLPAAVALYFDLEDRRDLDALERCLAPHATITDERRVYTGLPEIKAWRLETARKYQHTTRGPEVEPAGLEDRCHCPGIRNFPRQSRRSSLQLCCERRVDCLPADWMTELRVFVPT
jgi:hypothetical protein